MVEVLKLDSLVEVLVLDGLVEVLVLDDLVDVLELDNLVEVLKPNDLADVLELEVWVKIGALEVELDMLLVLLELIFAVDVVDEEDLVREAVVDTGLELEDVVGASPVLLRVLELGGELLLVLDETTEETPEVEMTLLQAPSSRYFSVVLSRTMYK
jgi:hypothetical protein